MHQENEIVECKKVQCLVVRDLKLQVRILLPKVYTREAIPYNEPHQIFKPEVAMQWDHLNWIPEERMPHNEPDVLNNQKTDPGSRGDHRLLVHDLHGISSGL